MNAAQLRDITTAGRSIAIRIITAGITVGIMADTATADMVTVIDYKGMNQKRRAAPLKFYVVLSSENEKGLHEAGLSF